VCVGDDVPRAIDEKAGAERLLLQHAVTAAPPTVGKKSEGKAERQLAHLRCAYVVNGGDVDDGRGYPRYQRRHIGRPGKNWRRREGRGSRPRSARGGFRGVADATDRRRDAEGGEEMKKAGASLGHCHCLSNVASKSTAVGAMEDGRSFHRLFRRGFRKGEYLPARSAVKRMAPRNLERAADGGRMSLLRAA
jgi:hypothetical protein